MVVHECNATMASERLKHEQSRGCCCFRTSADSRTVNRREGRHAVCVCCRGLDVRKVMWGDDSQMALSAHTKQRRLPKRLDHLDWHKGNERRHVHTRREQRDLAHLAR